MFKLLGFLAGWKGMVLAVAGAIVAVIVWVKAERHAGYVEGKNVCELAHATALAKAQAAHQKTIHAMQEAFATERDQFLQERQTYDARIGDIMDGFELPSGDEAGACLVPEPEHERLLEVIKARDARLGLIARPSR